MVLLDLYSAQVKTVCYGPLPKNLELKFSAEKIFEMNLYFYSLKTTVSSSLETLFLPISMILFHLSKPDI